MTDSLLTRYRPQAFDEVIGQDPVVRQLQLALKENRGRAYLFSGLTGCGKTTLARIAAVQLGCKPENLTEIDAATHSGVEEMREVVDGLRYQPIGGGVKALIVDECHDLSAKAWESLLKIIEEPPSWVYWFFCTTNLGKVPKTIMTRSLHFALKPVPRGMLVDLVEVVADAEKMQLASGILDLCVNEAEGSPRQALANLGVCAGAKDRAEAAELLRAAMDSIEAFNLAQALVRGANWAEIAELISGLKETPAETVRHVVQAYVTKAVLAAKSPDKAGRGIEILDAFSGMFHPSDGMSPVIIACGRCVFRA